MLWVVLDGPSRTMPGTGIEQQWVALSHTVRASCGSELWHVLGYSGSPLPGWGETVVGFFRSPQQSCQGVWDGAGTSCSWSHSPCSSVTQSAVFSGLLWLTLAAGPGAWGGAGNDVSRSG